MENPDEEAKIDKVIILKLSQYVTLYSVNLLQLLLKYFLLIIF